MRIADSFVHSFLALAALGGVSLVTGPAKAASPVLAWEGVREVRVLCHVASDAPARAEKLRERLCEAVVRLAGEGAPAPVSRLQPGDPALLERDVATLLVHASLTGGDAPLLTYHIRPFRAGGAETAILFGAVPKAVRLPQSGDPSPELETALRASLAETLPWLARQRGARPIDR